MKGIGQEMTQKEIIKLLGNDKYKHRVVNLGNNKTQIIIEPKHTNCAMCNTQVETHETHTRQDRRMVALIVEKKYCKTCANSIDEILSNIRSNYKEPLGVSI